MSHENRLVSLYYENDYLRFSRVENGYIIADLRCNEYHYIDDEKSRLIDELVRRAADGEGHAVAVSFGEISKYNNAAAVELVSEGLLSVREGAIHIAPYRLTWAKQNLCLPWPNRRKKGTGVWRIAIFLLSFGWATVIKWIDRPSLAVASVKLAKKIGGQKKHVQDADISYAYDDFCSLRRYLYTAHDRCFYDSMVVSIYMALLGYNSCWVFGAQLYPFRAHCWVKVDETLLTDQLALIVGYTPLFAV